MNVRFRMTRLLLSVALLLLLVLGNAFVASGYIKQTPTRLLLSGPNVVRCDRDAAITARVINRKTGKPVRHQIVRWKLVRKQSPGDRVSSTGGATGQRGTTTARLSFGPKAGARTVRASIAGSTPIITIRCAGGLPRTATVPPMGYQEPAAPAAFLPPPPATMDAPLPATGVRMERLGIDLPIVEGDGYSVPDGAAAHYPGTAWPGEGSNMYLYAHARAGHFLELWKVRTGDLVEVQLADGGNAAYRVSEIHPVVPWDALEYLEPGDRDVLTLQTCLTYEETAPRFVVIAERVHSA
jgi:LPXTG-site transpeptidase (sortase) family protein